LLRSARREVRLFSPHLDSAVFNTDAVTGALAAFATQHGRNRARVLLEDATQVLRDNSRLISLARRLPDNVELRELEDADRGARDAYLVADRAAYFAQADVTRSEATVVTQKSRDLADLIERFEAAWERSRPVALRPLGL
jgi:hypothetical protein